MPDLPLIEDEEPADPEEPQNLSLLTRLKRRYEAPAFVVIDEVGNGTGGYRRRTADAIAIGLWPSRGIFCSGFEFKISRSDWLRELKEPAKAEEIAKYCDYWWLVVSDPKIVLPGELPPTWGLLAPRRDSLKVIVDAPKLPAQPWDRPFVAGIIQRALSRMVPKSEIEAKLEEARQSGRNLAGYDRRFADEERQKLQEKVDEFTKASGISLDRYSWNLGNIGGVVKSLSHYGPKEMKSRMQGMVNTLKVTLEQARESLDECEKLWPEEPDQP